AAAIAFEHVLEISEIFRRTVLEEVSGTALRLPLLVLVVEPAADRMMGIMRLHDEIRDGQLQLMNPQASGFVLGREPVAIAEIPQNVCGLADQELAGPEERRRERRA